MNKNNGKQNGFTLIEVLLSIILLSIILTSFIGFFTQSVMFMQKNGQRLSTIQTSQKYIGLIEEYISAQDLASNTKTEAVMSTSTSTVVINKTEIHQLIETDMNNTDILDMEKELNSPYNITATITNDCPQDLIQVKVSVADSHDPNNISETYTYIRK